MSKAKPAPGVAEPIPRGQGERVSFDNGDTVTCTITYQSGEEASAGVESTGNLAADQASAEAKAKEL